MYSGLEACLGSSLEIQVDLQKSYRLQEQYKRIGNIRPSTPLLNVPQNQTPLLLALSSRKQGYKTIVMASEEYPEQQELLQ